MFNSSIKFLRTKGFNELKTKYQHHTHNPYKLLIETRRIKWNKRRWLTRFKTRKNGEEVDEGRGGDARGPKLAGRSLKSGSSWRLFVGWLLATHGEGGNVDVCCCLRGEENVDACWWGRKKWRLVGVGRSGT